ncbi:MAG: ABC transporter permease DevC [Nostocaceae cyanobacterium]|nr:ABC transporter permease DevC [Nostocaceae cyanobacterium]
MKLPAPKTFFSKLFAEPPIGWAQLSHEKIRLLVALSGIAFADILIFMMLGFKDMLFEGSTFVHNHIVADLVLISNRTKTLLEHKTFSRHHLFQASAVDGVASARPLYYSFGEWVNPWTKGMTNVAVIGFDPAQPVLDLQPVNQQLDQIKLPNVVLFDSKSQMFETGPVVESFTQGKTITTELSGRRIRVGGIFTLGSGIFVKGHIITSDWNYLRLFGQDTLDNIPLGLLQLKPNADPQAVIKNLQASLPKDLQVMTNQDFKKHELAYWNSVPGGVIFNFGAIMGFIVGVVIVNQVLYSDVNDHLPEYATLKAMGYSDISLLVIVFQEAMILAVLGFIPGFVSSIGMYRLLANLTSIPIAMRLNVASQVFLATFVMCLISAAISIRKLQNADPADVF